ncbi:hypothetical protein BG005_007425 [Podila minutissima]|nr:hypothetical protein BG005_007425 [Podila minutissima]
MDAPTDSRIMTTPTIANENIDPTVKSKPSIPDPRIADACEVKNPLHEPQKVALKAFCDAEVKDFEKAMDDLKIMMEAVATDLTKPSLTKDQVIVHLGAMVGGYSKVFEALTSLTNTVAKTLSDDKTAATEDRRVGGGSEPKPEPEAESKPSL